MFSEYYEPRVTVTAATVVTDAIVIFKIKLLLLTPNVSLDNGGHCLKNVLSYRCIVLKALNAGR